MFRFAEKPQSAALAFIVSGSIWFVIGTLYGLIDAIHFVAPEFFSNIPALVFSRVRPVHVNTILYGFVGSVLIGCGVYMVPALLKTRLWSERLGWFSWLMWNLTVLSGPITFAMGHSQGREYSEYVWTADVLLMISVLALIYNLVMTIANRNENQLYVTIWYVMGAMIWTAGCYPIGNVMWRPQTGAMRGLIDSVFLWFWGHNFVGLLLTPLAVGAAYFVVPRIAKTKLNSHTLSLVGFWMLVALYSHIGGHHILQSPIPNWLKTVSVVDSVMMVIPVFVAVYNIWMTARGHWNDLWGDPAGRFVMAGLAWYIVVCVQGPLQSLPQMQRVTHFNNWTVGHAHAAVLGFSAFIGLGAMWHLMPMVARRKVWSPRLVNLQFGLVLTGITGFFVILTIAGLIQGHSWNNGETVYRVIPMIYPYMVMRMATGLFIITSSFVGLWNLVMTLKEGEPVDPRDIPTLEQLLKEQEQKQPEPAGVAS